MNPPRVTIGMPVYNGANYIAEAIDALLAQTHEDFELVISDNNSADRTEQICQAYGRYDPRVSYVRHPHNRGAIQNFNDLVTQARGEYFKWAAHDDLCEPTYLEKCVQVLDDRPDVVWCHTDSDQIDAAGNSLLARLPEDDEEVLVAADGNRRWFGLPRKDCQSSRPSKRFEGVLLGTRWCVDSYGVMRLSTLKQTRLFADIYGSEKVLIGELSLSGKYYQVPENLFQQRIHLQASSCQDSAALQHEYVAAQKGPRFSSARLALLRAHAQAVWSAPISPRERAHCCLTLLKYVAQYRKWSRIASSMLAGRGVGGEGRGVVDRAARYQSQQQTSGKPGSTTAESRALVRN